MVLCLKYARLLSELYQVLVVVFPGSVEFSPSSEHESCLELLSRVPSELFMSLTEFMKIFQSIVARFKHVLLSANPDLQECRL